MRLTLLLFLSLFSTSTFAQNNLNGTWNAITTIKKGVSLLSQEWIFDNNSLQINIIKNDKNSSKRVWGTFSYIITKNKLELKTEDINLSFDIVERTKKALTIKNDDYLIFLKNQAFHKARKIDIPYLKTFRMKTENEYQCYGCTFSFLKHAFSNYLLFFVNDSLVNITLINNFSEPEYQKASTLIERKQINSILFEYLNQDSISGLINHKIPFKLIPKEENLPISIKQLIDNQIIQKGNTKLSQLTSEDRKTIFIGREKLKLNEDGTGSYSYSMRINQKSVNVSADVKWYLSNDHNYLFTSYTSPKGDRTLYQTKDTRYFNIYHIRKVAEGNWELTKTLHKRDLF